MRELIYQHSTGGACFLPRQMRLGSHHKTNVVDEEDFAFVIMSQETRFWTRVGHQPAMWPLDSGYPSLSLSCLNSKMSRLEVMTSKVHSSSALLLFQDFC